MWCSTSTEGSLNYPPTDRPPTDRPPTADRPTSDRPPTACTCPTVRPVRPTDRTDRTDRPTRPTTSQKPTDRHARGHIGGDRGHIRSGSPCAKVAQNRYVLLVWSASLSALSRCVVSLLCALCAAAVGTFPSLSPTSLPIRLVLLYRYEDGSEEGHSRSSGSGGERGAGEDEALLCRCQAARPTLESAPYAWAGSGALFRKEEGGRIT